MSENPAALMSVNDLLNMPDDNWRYELTRGELVRRAYGSAQSGVVSATVGAELGRYVAEHGLGICSIAGGFMLETNPDTVRAPSIGFIGTERVPANGIPEGYWQGAPDLAVEVISPSDGFSYMLVKICDFLSAGTRLVWVVDPQARKAIVFRPNQAYEIIDADGELSGELVVPGFILRLAEI